MNAGDGEKAHDELRVEKVVLLDDDSASRGLSRNDLPFP